jgi:hypothetical protein
LDLNCEINSANKEVQKMAADTYEDLNCETIESDFDDYEDDFCIKPRTEKKHQVFVKKFKKRAVYDVKDSHQPIVNKIALLEIPLRSKELLTKLVVNRHLEDIKTVKPGENSTILQAKINLQNKNFCHLESNDVIIKIFTGKNNKKSDVKTAEKYEFNAYNIVKDEKLKNCIPRPNVNEKPLTILTLENIVIMKMIGKNQPAKTIFEMVKENPQNVKLYYCEILKAIRSFKYQYYRFWYSKASMNGILWDGKNWVILNRVNIVDKINYNSDESESCFASNLAMLIKTFESFGMKVYDIQQEFHKTFFGKCVDESLFHWSSYYFRNGLQHKEFMNIVEWNQRYWEE